MASKDTPGQLTHGGTGFRSQTGDAQQPEAPAALGPVAGSALQDGGHQGPPRPGLTGSGNRQDGCGSRRGGIDRLSCNPRLAQCQNALPEAALEAGGVKSPVEGPARALGPTTESGQTERDGQHSETEAGGRPAGCS